MEKQLLDRLNKAEKRIVDLYTKLSTEVTPINSIPYKVYAALLSQSETDAPVATVLENTLGDIYFTYDITGIYNIYSDGLFTLGKTAIISGNEASFNDNGQVNNFLLQGIIDEPGRIILYTTESANGNSGFRNNYLNNRFIEIRVYN